MKTSQEIKNEIVNALKENPMLNAVNIDVDIIGNVVWLSGVVDCFQKKFIIKEAVKNFIPERHFRLNMHVELPAHTQYNAAEIRNEIINEIEKKIPGANVTVSVTNGIVILSGTLPFVQSEDLLWKILFSIPGITNVWNFVKIEPKQLFEKPLAFGNTKQLQQITL